MNQRERPGRAATRLRPRETDRLISGTIPSPIKPPNALVNAERSARKGRAGNGVSCLVCSSPLHPKRGSRRQKFCSYRCRDEARRARNYAVLGGVRRGSQGIPRSVENNADNSNACNGHFGDRASHICGPARVIEREVFARWNWRAITSADGVVVEVAIVR